MQRSERGGTMIVVGTDSGIYRFSLEGGKWSPQGSALDGVSVFGLASDPTKPGHVLAGARETGIFESFDSGETWEQTAFDVDPWSIDVAPDGTAYAGTRPSAVYYRPPGGEWGPLNTLEDQPAYGSWTFPTAPHLPNIRDVGFSPSDPNTLYAAVEVGGLLVSTNGGASWDNFRESVHQDIHSITVAPGEEDVIYAATGRGFYRSFNAGRQWEPACEGLEGIYLVPIVANTEDPHTLMTAATNGRPRYWRTRDSGAEAVIYRSKDGGSRWAPAMNGLPEQLTGAVEGLAVDRANPGAVYAATQDGHVYASGSFGDEWVEVANGLPPAHAVAAAS
jgi:photosystem II stability/assembly factor-like uncharacterized protein